ncbi:hypothetical protein [Lactobacillus acetotolerans]|uniref:hypothetical protein n=1 Tax=Lactobacillus acetotolerans TaxID=1600 RepID=UPI002FDA6674
MNFRVFQFEDGRYLHSMKLTIYSHFDFSTCEAPTDAKQFPIDADISILNLLNGKLVTYRLEEID